MSNQITGNYAANSKLAILNRIYNCLSAWITQRLLSKGYKLTHDSRVNIVSIYLIPYIISCITTANQGIIKGKTVNNNIYNCMTLTLNNSNSLRTCSGKESLRV